MLKFKYSRIFLGLPFLLHGFAVAAEYRVDTTYGTNGNFRQVGGAVKGVIIQPNGQILLASSMTEAGKSFSSFALLRQNSNGILDNAFGTNGIRFTDFGTSTSATANGMAESPVDGKVVIVGSKGGFAQISGQTVYQSDFAIACFDSDGSPDTDFNSTGKTTASFDPYTNPVRNFPYALSGAECVVVQADGKIVVGGWAEVGTSSRRFALLRYNANGTIDSGFGGGFVVTNPGGYCTMSALAISPVDQKIIAVGYYQDPVSYGYRNMIVRYKTDGTLDTDFDTDGMVFTGSGNQNHQPGAVAVQADGKIVVAGSTFVKNPFAEPEDFALFRYLDSGAPDPDFGTAGFVSVDSVGGYDRLRAIKLQGNGKILVAGTVGGDPADPSSVSSLALLMFDSDGSLDTDFDGDGMVVSTGPSTREGYCFAQQTDGKIIVAGEFEGENSNPGEAAAIRFEQVPVIIPATRKPDLLVGLTTPVKVGSNIYNATGINQVQTFKLDFRETDNAFIGIQNDGSAADSFKVRATAGNNDFSVRYFKGSTNITNAIVAGTYRTSNLAPKATETLKVVVAAKSKKSAEKRTLEITASSVAKPSAIDKALFKVSSKAKPN